MELAQLWTPQLAAGWDASGAHLQEEMSHSHILYEVPDMPTHALLEFLSATNRLDPNKYLI